MLMVVDLKVSKLKQSPGPRGVVMKFRVQELSEF